MLSVDPLLLHQFIHLFEAHCLFSPRDKHRAFNAKLFLYRRRNVQTAIDTGGEWVVTTRLQYILETNDVSLLLQGHVIGLKRCQPIKKIKHSSFSDKLSAVFARCQTPTACGFCRVLFISSHLMLLLSVSLSLSLSVFPCYSFYTYFLISGLLFRFSTPQDEKSFCSAIIVNPSCLQKGCVCLPVLKNGK